MKRILIAGLLMMWVGAGFANLEITVNLPGGATMDFVWIEPGTFLMGSSGTGGESDERPQHEVTISRGFFLGKYEITQAQWEAVMGTTPWSGSSYVQSDPNHPASYISWEADWLFFWRNGVQEFIQRLNEAAGDSLYRLPTEAEWEYACRAGTTTRWSFGDDESQLRNYAWYKGSVGNVGGKLPNPWGLYDMHGNVSEWVQDWLGGYSSYSQVDPTGPATGSHGRVMRGGTYNDIAHWVRSAARLGYGPSFRRSDFGARLLRTGPAPTPITPKTGGQITDPARTAAPLSPQSTQRSTPSAGKLTEDVATIEGRVTLPHQASRTWVRVRVEDLNGEVQGEGSADEHGYYQLWVVSGSYRVSVVDAEGVEPVEVTLTAGEQIEGIDFAPTAVKMQTHIGPFGYFLIGGVLALAVLLVLVAFIAGGALWRGLERSEEMRPSYFWLFLAGPAWAVMFMGGNYWRLGNLSLVGGGGGDGWLLGFILVGVLSGLLLIFLLRKCIILWSRFSLACGYALATPVGFVFGMSGPFAIPDEVHLAVAEWGDRLLLEGVFSHLFLAIVVAVFGSVPLAAGSGLGYGVGKLVERRLA